MATIVENLYKIKERASSFNITDDNKLSDEFLIATMNDVRASLIKEEYNSKGYIADAYYQMNCCYEIECLEGSCVYDGVEIGDGKYSYQVKLKSHVKGLNGSEIKHIGDRLGSVKFNIMNFNQFTSLEGRVWTKNTSAALVLADAIHLKNLPTPGMKFVCLLEILEDPRNSCDWIDDTTEYPVPSATKLVDMVLYRLMISGRMPDDKLNNATDDTVNPKIADELIGQQQRMQTEFSNRPQSTSNQQKK